MDVIYNNGFGYEEEDESQKYVNCNQENHL